MRPNLLSLVKVDESNRNLGKYKFRGSPGPYFFSYNKKCLIKNDRNSLINRVYQFSITPVEPNLFDHYGFTIWRQLLKLETTVIFPKRM